MLERSMTLHEHYELEREPFAVGVNSRLYRCRSRRRHDKPDSAVYVAKLFDKNRLTERRANLARNEAAIGAKLPPSPFLARVIDFYDEEDVMSHRYNTPTRYLCIVMDYLGGGTLLDRIRARGPLNENEARRFVTQILTAVSTMHSAGTMHRDIKPENVFFRSRHAATVPDSATTSISRTHDKMHSSSLASSSSVQTDGRRNMLVGTVQSITEHTEGIAAAAQDARVDCAVLGDFGFATDVVPSSDYVGSPQYSAPETALIALQYHTQTKIQPVYGEMCDVWSVGVVTFVMLTGLLPFDGADPTEVFTKVIRNAIPFEPIARTSSAVLPPQRVGAEREVSAAAKAFILELTKTNPAARPSAQEALRHKWLAAR